MLLSCYGILVVWWQGFALPGLSWHCIGSVVHLSSLHRPRSYAAGVPSIPGGENEKGRSSAAFLGSCLFMLSGPSDDAHTQDYLPFCGGNNVATGVQRLD
jgi:hypothetical protein